MKSLARIRESLPHTQDLLVNDKHSQLNSTSVRSIIAPFTEAELAATIRSATLSGQTVSICGGRHAMGGQQFHTNSILIDTSNLNSVITFDPQKGTVTAQAGITWPQLMQQLRLLQQNAKSQWTIAQKQTGCDDLSLGGALSANVHGRGLRMPPIVNDVEEFTLVLSNGSVVLCSRNTNADLFRLAIGGYGLFGVISSVTLRLVPRLTLRRHVELCTVDQLMVKLDGRIKDGARYGDFQFAINDTSPDFLNLGILSTYRPCKEFEQDTAQRKLLSTEAWRELVLLAHKDKELAFKKYASHYLSTNGQTYDSETFQLSTYLDNYHRAIDKSMNSTCPGTEMISELYVPRSELPAFLAKARHALRREKASVIYGTVRLIEADTETFLPWAREPWACTVFNLHVDHCATGLAQARRAFVALIECAQSLGGSYYLTYHKFAEAHHLLQSYPQMREFMELKHSYDPTCTFRSNWFDHYQAMLG